MVMADSSLISSLTSLSSSLTSLSSSLRHCRIISIVKIGAGGGVDLSSVGIVVITLGARVVAYGLVVLASGLVVSISKTVTESTLLSADVVVARLGWLLGSDL